MPVAASPFPVAAGVPQGLVVQGLRGARIGPVSFTLAAGECMALTGASGAGKTLLLRQLADLDPGEGDVSLAGRSRGAYPAATWRRRVMLVPAAPGWWASTVAEHFPETSLADAARLCASMRLPAGILQREVIGLSTGERQRLALVRALVAHPDILLLLDEPTSGLDVDAVAAVERCLEDARQGGTALLVVTHDPAQARRIASSTYRLDGGTLRPA
jgi:phosphate-transporting ATPase